MGSIRRWRLVSLKSNATNQNGGCQPNESLRTKIRSKRDPDVTGEQAPGINFLAAYKNVYTRCRVPLIHHMKGMFHSIPSILFTKTLKNDFPPCFAFRGEFSFLILIVTGFVELGDGRTLIFFYFLRDCSASELSSSNYT